MEPNRAFDDDDLRRLKDWIITADPLALDHKLDYLLVRLEESEKLNDAFIGGFKDAVAYRLETWRRATGRADND